jgi:hypothetical protein
VTDEHGNEHEDVMSSLLDLQRRLRGDGSAVREPSAPSASSTVGEESTPAPDPSAPPVITIPQNDPPPTHPDDVVVSERDLSVLMTPTEASASEVEAERFAPVTQLPTAAVVDDRVAALADRLARLEEDLSGVMGSIASVREDVGSDMDARVTAVQADADVKVSFLKADVSSQVAAEVTAGMTANLQRMQAESHARVQRTVGERLYAIESRLVGELGEQREALERMMAERFEGMDAALRNAVHRAAADAGADNAPGSPGGDDSPESPGAGEAFPD